MVRHTNTDALLLELIQKDFPLVSCPFEEIGRRLSIEPAEVIASIKRLKNEGVIRQINAIFDSKALGYRSALAAFKVRDTALDAVGEALASNAYVSHCYSRQAEYNLWFTVTVGPEGVIEREVLSYAELDGVEGYLILPAIKVYKIGVFLKMTKEKPTNTTSSSKPAVTLVHNLSPQEKDAVKALQIDLPLVKKPFQELADNANMSEDKLLQYAKYFIEKGIMRRFAAVLRHTRAGYKSHAMVCWGVDAERIDQAGRLFASNSAVSHCYERPTFPDWPYPLYTMIHAHTNTELQTIIQELITSSDISEYVVLPSIKEYKKSRVLYF